MSIATDTVLDAAMLPVGGAAGQVLEKTNGANYAVEWADPGAGGGFTPTMFQSWMTTSFTNVTGPAVIAGWDAEELTHADYSFVPATGILTINTAGTYAVSGHVLADDSGNNRVELWARLSVNGSPYQQGGLDVMDRQYAMRNNSQNEGSAQLNNVLIVLGVGDTLALEAGYAGAANDVTMARLTVIKMG